MSMSHPASANRVESQTMARFTASATRGADESAKERTIRMKPPRQVSKLEKITFPIIGLLFCAFIVPSGLPLLGMLFFGNLLKECGVTKRLSEVASNAVVNINYTTLLS